MISVLHRAPWRHVPWSPVADLLFQVISAEATARANADISRVISVAAIPRTALISRETSEEVTARASADISRETSEEAIARVSARIHRENVLILRESALTSSPNSARMMRITQQEGRQ